MKKNFITKQNEMCEEEIFAGVDTLAFNFNIRNRKDKIDVAIAIKNKLYIKNKVEHWYAGSYGEYNFYFNAPKDNLAVMLEHGKIKGKTEEEIEEKAAAVVKEYFGIEHVKLRSLNRIEFRIDYKLKTEEEKQIIMELIDKAENKRYTYIKQITTQDGFYKAKLTKENNRNVEIAIYDKEEEWKVHCKKERNRK